MTGAFIKLGDRSVELRYTAKRAERLEKELDSSLLNGLSKTDRVGVVAQYVAAGADMTVDEAYKLYDEFAENGGTLEDIVEVIVDAMANGGYISKIALNALETSKKMRNQLIKAQQS